MDYFCGPSFYCVRGFFPNSATNVTRQELFVDCKLCNRIIDVCDVTQSEEFRIEPVYFLWLVLEGIYFGCGH